MGGRSTCFHGLLLLLLLVVSFSQQTAAASGRNSRLLARLLQPSGSVCEPWSVPETERCAYIQDHAAICYPEGGFQAYLAIHFCWFPPYWRWVSLLLLVAAAALALAVLLTVSERFFCPALELISDYLKLPPVVAGATLLSFGNGAPDTFTQVAAVGQVCVGVLWGRGLLASRTATFNSRTLQHPRPPPLSFAHQAAMSNRRVVHTAAYPQTTARCRPHAVRDFVWWCCVLISCPNHSSCRRAALPSAWRCQSRLVAACLPQTWCLGWSC